MHYLTAKLSEFNTLRNIISVENLNEFEPLKIGLDYDVEICRADGRSR